MSEQNERIEAHTYDDLYPWRFIKAGNLRGKRVTLTIADVWVEELEGSKGPQKKAILAFERTPAQYVLPKINAVCLRAMFGADVRAWVGRRVTIYATDRVMPMPLTRAERAAGKSKPDECIRIFGSPEIDRPMTVEFLPPRRKPIRMTMHPTGTRKPEPPHNPETGEVSDGPEMTPDGVPVPDSVGVSRGDI